MNNNYDFWQKYLKLVKKELKKLCHEKDELHIDLHMHSNYSADGKQSVSQLIENTKNKGFDVIAITDHDTLDAYDELFNIVKEGLTNPIIIPGIEFTMDNRKYGGQCHMLELFINPKDKTLMSQVDKNKKAMFNRSRIQFKRLKENITIANITKENKIKISYEDYLKYLEINNLIPEYDTLCFYLIDKFKTKNITTFEILERLEKDNELDCYEDRKQFKARRYKKLRGKYEQTAKNNYNSRFLLSMLAVREVDDDWWDKPSSGSLSVNSYGQLKIEELTNNYKIFFAHPEEKKLTIVREIINKNPRIIGAEKNIRSDYEDRQNFDNLINDLSLLKVIGSDSHDNSGEFYEDMDFYLISNEDMLDVINNC